MTNNGINILQNHSIVNWTIDDNNEIESIHVVSDFKNMMINCSMLVSFEEKIVGSQLKNGKMAVGCVIKFCKTNRIEKSGFLN